MSTRSLTTIRPPGLSARNASRNTWSLCGERLITQFEITTSTESAGSGTCSITPLRKIAFDAPASSAFLPASASISSVMSKPNARPVRPFSRTAAIGSKRFGFPT